MEDLENSEIMEAYNRLSLLLDQQKPSSPEIESNIPFKSENNKKKINHTREQNRHFNQFNRS